MADGIRGERELFREVMTSCAKGNLNGALRAGTRTSTIKVFSLGLVPARAFCASQSKAAPYGSDKRKIDTEQVFIR